MGFRTVVILNNDLAHEWAHDPLLGQKIGTAMNYASMFTTDDRACVGNYGKVVECVHADAQTLAVIDSLDMTPVAVGHWYMGQDMEQARLELVKQAAANLGYNLTKKRSKK